jgi:hypothetical protein
LTFQIVRDIARNFGKYPQKYPKNHKIPQKSPKIVFCPLYYEDLHKGYPNCPGYYEEKYTKIKLNVPFISRNSRKDFRNCPGYFDEI